MFFINSKYKFHYLISSFLLICFNCIFVTIDEGYHFSQDQIDKDILIDSLPVINKKSLNVKNDGIYDTIEKYHQIALQLEQKIKDLKIEIEINKLKLSNINQFLASEYGISGNRAFKEKFKNTSFDCYEVISSNFGKIHFYLNDSAGKNIFSLSNLSSMLKSEHKLLVFATNAGMYTSEHQPQGLYVENRKIRTTLDTRTGLYGNFYIQPNGVFYLDTCEEAGILSTSNIEQELLNSFKYATQSGPMVVVDGKINPNFKEGSENTNIRSGVGINEKGNIVFVISNEKVNFYDFSSFFKYNLKCKNALYLDGAISEAFIPELGRRQNGGMFGPMIGIVK
ncbi:MAG: phosphodiester glycosidase family protein [Saprospiraceae bacterium]|nr:phosphodiester glycosidase family protein [Saprospiraceae bacterium]